MLTRIRQTWKTKQNLISIPTAALALVAAWGPVRSASAQRPLGVDVSSYQGGSISWTSVKGAGITYGWAKATEATTVADADFVGNENNGKAAGVYMGAYHFAHPNLDTPAAEASYFWGKAGGYILADGKTIMPMLDFEVFSGVDGASSYSDWANQWCNAIVADASANGVPVKPVIYCSACDGTYFNSSVAQWYSSIADYNSESAQTGTPWSTCSGDDVWGSGVWTSWQYTSTGTISGIPGNVDHDVFNGTLATLEAALVIAAPDTKPVIVVTTNGAVSSFFIAEADGSVQTDWQTILDGPWSGPSLIVAGHGFGSISGLVQTNNCMAMFGCGGGPVYVCSQSTPGGTWSAWASLGGSGFTKCKGVVFNDGRMAVVGCGGGEVYYQEQTSVDGPWTGWSAILSSSGNTTVDAIVVPYTDCVSVFAAASDGAVQTAWQTTPHGAWGGWLALGGVGFEKLKCVVFGDGHLGLVGCGGSDAYWQEQVLTGGGWPAGGWSAIPGLGGATEVDAVITTNQCVSVFACGGNAVYTAFQNAPRGTWSDWFSLGGSGFESLAAAILPGDRMAIVGCASGTTLNYADQTSTGSSWNPWAAIGGTVK